MSRFRPDGARLHRRGLVILVVLVVVAVSATIASSVLLRVDAGTIESRGALRTSQSRAAAWSGVQAIMARLDEQREDLLAGQSPVLPESWTFPVESPAGQIVFRILPAPDGLPAESENARLDINVATQEMLAALDGVDESLAARIVANRPGSGYHSVEALASVDGIMISALLGEGGLARADGVPAIDAASLGFGEDAAAPLASLLTAWSFDPNVQGAGDAIGARRVPLPSAWTDELDRAIERRLGRDATDAIRAIAQSDQQPTSVGAVAGALRRAGAPVEAWGVVLDTFAVSGASHARGLVDVNRAPESVLAAIPGLDAESARAIVDARERVSLDSRSTIAWIVEQELVTPEAFEQAADWLTTRSTQWRVRVEGGFEPVVLGQTVADNADGPSDFLDLGPVGSNQNSGLLDRVVLEAVVDVSTRRPRLAALREITGREFVLALAARDQGQADDSQSERPDDFDLDVPPELDSPLDPSELPEPPRLVSPRERDRDTSGASEAPAADPSAGSSAANGRSGRWGGQP